MNRNAKNTKTLLNLLQNSGSNSLLSIIFRQEIAWNPKCRIRALAALFAFCDNAQQSSSQLRKYTSLRWKARIEIPLPFAVVPEGHVGGGDDVVKRIKPAHIASLFLSFQREGMRLSIESNLFPFFYDVVLFLVPLDEKLRGGQVEADFPGRFGNLHLVGKDLFEEILFFLYGIGQYL